MTMGYQPFFSWKYYVIKKKKPLLIFFFVTQVAVNMSEAVYWKMYETFEKIACILMYLFLFLECPLTYCKNKHVAQWSLNKSTKCGNGAISLKPRWKNHPLRLFGEPCPIKIGLIVVWFVFFHPWNIGHLVFFYIV